MEQSCWEAKSQEIPHLSWNPKVHYCVCKNLPLVSVLSQMHPVHTFSPYFPMIHSNIIFPSMPKSSAWFLPFIFSNRNFVCISHRSYPCYMPCPSHPPWLYHLNNIWSDITLVSIISVTGNCMNARLCNF